MAKFLVTYHGGGEPTPQDMAAAKAAFGKWVAHAGKVVTDPGAPLAFVAQVANGPTATKAAIGGYSLLEADSAETVIALLRTHPYVTRGGTLQVSQQVAV